MKVLVFAASLRKESLNRKLAKLAAAAAQKSAADVTELDLKDYLLPYVDMDIEDADPRLEPRTRLAKVISEHDALLISSPEYNFSLPGHFKNTIDWLSRLRPMPWTGKQVLLISASPALAGGARGLWQLRIPLEGCGAFVFPDMFSLSQADQAFDTDGSLRSAKIADNLSALVAKFCQHVTKIS